MVPSADWNPLPGTAKSPASGCRTSSLRAKGNPGRSRSHVSASLTSERLAQMQRTWDFVESTTWLRDPVPPIEQAHQPRATTPAPEPLSRHDASRPQPTTAELVQTVHSHLGHSPTIYTKTPPGRPPRPKSKVVRLLFNPKSKPHRPPRRSDLAAARDHPQVMAVRQMPPTRNNLVDDLTTHLSRAGLFNAPPLYLQPEPRYQELEISHAGPRLEAGSVYNEATSRPHAGPIHAAPLPPQPESPHRELEIPRAASTFHTGGTHDHAFRSYARPSHTAPLPPQPERWHQEPESSHAGPRLRTGATHSDAMFMSRGELLLSAPLAP